MGITFIQLIPMDQKEKRISVIIGVALVAAGYYLVRL